jgi:hypothetical protein
MYCPAVPGVDVIRFLYFTSAFAMLSTAGAAPRLQQAPAPADDPTGFSLTTSELEQLGRSPRARLLTAQAGCRVEAQDSW